MAQRVRSNSQGANPVGGKHVYPYRALDISSDHSLACVSLGGRTYMKPNRTLYVALLTILLVSLSFTAACQRNREDRVEAAREDHATAPADTGTANTDTSKVLSSDERDVAMKIEQAHLGEIDLSRLAKQQASSRDVKSFADMIENDHGSALKDLQKVMNKNGVEESTNSKPAEGKEELAKLQKLSGAQFDREFMN